MTSDEAVSSCEFWTTNLAETNAIGSTEREEIADFFGATLSVPRQTVTDPTGPRCYAINVARKIALLDDDGQPVREIGGGYAMIENPLYTKIAVEIGRRTP